MTPQEALRAIRLVRYQPLKARGITMAEVARAAGYCVEVLYRANRRGWVTQRMADRLEPVLRQTVDILSGQIASKSSLGRPFGGRDPRGGWRGGRRDKRGARTPAGHQSSIDERKHEVDQ